jgi:hypothetical protein
MLNTEVLRKKLQEVVRKKMKKKTNLERSIRVTEDSVEAPSYINFVEYGRRPGSMPPIKEILAFMRKRGLGSSNSAAFAIAHTIKKRGIKPIPLLEEMRIVYMNELLKDPLSAKDWDQLNLKLNNL